MNKNKNYSVYKTYGFWVSITAAILLVLQTILGGMDIKIDIPYITEIINGVLGVLVISGVIIKPKEKEELTGQDETTDETTDNIETQTPSDE